MAEVRCACGKDFDGWVTWRTYVQHTADSCTPLPRPPIATDAQWAETLKARIEPEDQKEEEG